MVRLLYQDAGQV